MSVDGVKKVEKFKCIVWDLDNTLWSGVLLEDAAVQLNEALIEVIRTLDKRGVLHSIASRNDYDRVQQKLIVLNIWDLFICPEIGWQDKSSSLANIAKRINIAMDSIAFVDDQHFERDEVQAMHPSISTFTPEHASEFPFYDAFTPKFITSESQLRRSYYQSDEKRKQEEMAYGNNVEFLKTLGLKLSINRLSEKDLERAEELTIRTHQLNTTGVSYSYDELNALMSSERHDIFCVTLEDKYGPYGTIGLVLLEKEQSILSINLLLVSCRVMSRNVVNTVLVFITQLAEKQGQTVQAKFVHNDVNRQMYITYKFAGFEEIHTDGSSTLLVLKKNQLIMPDYVEIRSDVL